MISGVMLRTSLFGAPCVQGGVVAALSQKTCMSMFLESSLKESEKREDKRAPCPYDGNGTVIAMRKCSKEADTGYTSVSKQNFH